MPSLRSKAAQSAQANVAARCHGGRRAIRRTLASLSLLSAMLFIGGAPARAALKVGSLTLRACEAEYRGYCGSIQQPLDRSGRLAGTITVSFEFYPHTDMARPPLEPIIAQEGGPGYSTTGSRDGYIRLFAPLRARRDILLVDKRGTGRSSAIDCPALQAAYEPSQRDIAACGQQLGPSAWKYRSADAADDVAAVMKALGFAHASYYGDSYGTWFGQVLAVRYPGLLKTVVLDSAYPVLGDHSNTEVNHGQQAMDLVCQRSAPCRRLGSQATARFAALLASLRAHPVRGTAPGSSGEPRAVTADPPGLFLVVANAGNSPATWRDLDAAGRAWINDKDSLPLLRLVAEARDSYSGGGGYREFSVGLADAVSCGDYGANFDQTAPVATRQRELEAHYADMRANRPDAFAPFTVDDAINSQMDAEDYDTCLTWPAPPAGVKPGQPIANDAKFPNVPTLVLSGELDTVTSPAEGQATAALFPNARFLVTTNLVHESAIGDAGVFTPPNGQDLAKCIGPIVRGFVASGGAVGDTSCLAAIRPIRTVPAFATEWSAMAPATATSGDAADKDGLRLASAVAETVGDALARYYVTTSGRGAGLRGGSFTVHATNTGYLLKLQAVRWTSDLSVSGMINWDQLTGDVYAYVDFHAQKHAGSLHLAWNDRRTDATASLTGKIDGVALAAHRLAP